MSDDLTEACERGDIGAVMKLFREGVQRPTVEQLARLMATMKARDLTPNMVGAFIDRGADVSLPVVWEEGSAPVSLADVALAKHRLDVLRCLVEGGAVLSPDAVAPKWGLGASAKRAWLEKRSRAEPDPTAQLRPREFVKTSRYTPEQAVGALVTDAGILGLRLGMSQDEAARLGFTEGKNGKAWIEVGDGVVERVRYEYDSNTYAGPDAHEQLVAAWTDKYGAPVERGRWDVGAGIVTVRLETLARIGGEALIVELGPGTLVATDEPVDRAQLGDEVRRCVDDIVARGVAAVEVEAQASGGWALEVSFDRGDEVLRMSWPDAPLKANGELSESLDAALRQAAFELFTR